MNQQEIKNLERELWDAADELRGNSKLTAGEYKDPLLGLVLLRFAQNRYEDAKIQVAENLAVNPRTGKKREVTKEDYAAAGAIMLPEKAKYDYLAALPESEDIAEAINNAMKLIEAEYTDLAGILPKSYQEFEDKLLRELVRVFNKDAVRNAKGDVFGRIYEFFLMKFSMQGAGAQEGGEFFTPPSLVNLIVNFIQPNHGIIHDPACGSGGMFVQTAHFIEDHALKLGKKTSINEAIKVYGTELKSNNAKLAKMNLAIHGIEGKIIEGNSFYTNPHELTGKCDFVMANPPFNVDKVDAKNKFLAEDARLPFGAPLTGNGAIGNGNYLFIQYFHSYLNASGRAGFVMASSATDAGNAEKLIRQKLIETGDVECIVSISNNFFYTRSLPCHVWFFNKGKKKKNKDKILMIDARNVYQVVSTTINDFSDGQMVNLSLLMDLFRETTINSDATHQKHQENCTLLLEKIAKAYTEQRTELTKLIATEKWETPVLVPALKTKRVDLQNIEAQKTDFVHAFDIIKQEIESCQAQLAAIEEKGKKGKLDKAEIAKQNKELKSKITKLGKPVKLYETAISEDLKALNQAIIDWQFLADKLPDGRYQDVEGLCKIVDIEEVKEQDYSLTPGRYVGVVVDLDMDFDYKGRMAAIHTELAALNQEANVLMNQIQAVKV